MVDDISKLSKYPETTMQFVAYISFLQSKERAGLERAYGSSGLAAGEFEKEVFENFKVMIADAKRFNQVFLNLASDVQKLSLTT